MEAFATEHGDVGNMATDPTGEITGANKIKFLVAILN